MDQTAIQTIVYATMRDPILWVLCIAIGWRLNRPLITLLWMLTAGGLFFGLFRGMIYRVAFNEPLEGGAFGIVVASALILTLAGGIAVHGLRMLTAGRGTSATNGTDTGASGGTPATKAGPASRRDDRAGRRGKQGGPGRGGQNRGSPGRGGQGRRDRG
ncbi:hypothetical protein P7L78_15400 [Tistrella bauzanensis]|uniref:hypothetical protein n=1 Tax=Tistrella TaxID=171436 RepID=UPI0031F6340C